MPKLLLGNKRRQFKQLAVLQQCRLNRANDPLSAYQREDHRTALLLVSDILKQEWSFLLFERRFLQDTRTYTETFTKAQVVDKLLAGLETYEKCLTHQAADPYRVRYDLSELERRLATAIETVHTLGQSANYEVVEVPKTSWKCTKEYEGWKANQRDMLDPLKGKIRLKERDVSGFASVIDGDITATFCDEFGEDVEELPLRETLPTELVTIFDQALGNAGNIDWDAEAKLQASKSAAPSLVPQGRSEFVFRPKSAVSIGTKLGDKISRIAEVKLGDQSDTIEHAEREERPRVRLSIRRKKAALA